MEKQDIRVSIIQAPLEWNDRKANLKYFAERIKKLKGNTDLIVLPEMFGTGFITDVSLIEETMEGQTFQWMKATSAAVNAVLVGSIALKEKNKFFNRLIWMRPDGSFEQYDKRHLFRMGDEHLKYTAGKKRLITEIKGWKVMPLVCYDLRFPVWSKNRLVNDEYEYDMILFVANWPASRSYAWRTLLSARAIENQVYCIGVNRIGEDGKGIPHKGGSVILDYKGKLIKCCKDNEPEVITETLTYQTLAEFRERFKVALDWDDFQLAAAPQTSIVS